MNKYRFLEVLINKNISQRRLAKKIGVNKDTLNNWINGNTFPTIDKIIDLCIALDITDPDMIIRIFFPQLMLSDK